MAESVRGRNILYAIERVKSPSEGATGRGVIRDRGLAVVVPVMIVEVVICSESDRWPYTLGILYAVHRPLKKTFDRGKKDIAQGFIKLYQRQKAYSTTRKAMKNDSHINSKNNRIIGLYYSILYRHLTSRAPYGLRV